MRGLSPNQLLSPRPWFCLQFANLNSFIFSKVEYVHWALSQMRSVCGSRVVITVCPAAGQAVSRELGPTGEGSVPAVCPGRRWLVLSEEAPVAPSNAWPFISPAAAVSGVSCEFLH